MSKYHHKGTCKASFFLLVLVFCCCCSCALYRRYKNEIIDSGLILKLFYRHLLFTGAEKIRWLTRVYIPQEWAKTGVLASWARWMLFPWDNSVSRSVCHRYHRYQVNWKLPLFTLLKILGNMKDSLTIVCFIEKIWQYKFSPILKTTCKDNCQEKTCYPKSTTFFKIENQRGELEFGGQWQQKCLMRSLTWRPLKFNVMS